MKIVASDDATARLEDLLESARGGEEVVITQRGEPVARLVPLRSRAPDFEAVSRRMAARRAAGHPAGVSARELIEEGRRF